MQIAVYITEARTYINLKVNEHIGEIQSFNSKIIFGNMDLVADRFLMILKKYFGVKDFKDISKIIFCVSGIINEKMGTVIECEELDRVSIIRTYSGFSFKECFSHYIQKENIVLLESTFAIALGLNSKSPKSATPSLLVRINYDVRIALLDVNRNSNPVDWGDQKVKEYGNKRIKDLIGKKGYEELIYSDTVDCFKEYSLRFTKIIAQLVYLIMNEVEESKTGFTEVSEELYPLIHQFRNLIKTSPQGFLKFKSQKPNIIIFSNLGNIVERKLLSNLSSKVDFTFMFENIGNVQNIQLQLLGCFDYLSKGKKFSSRIVKVEYYSGKEKIYTFTNFDKFFAHWNSVKAFGNRKNYYSFYYEDEKITTITLGELKWETDVKQFRF